MLCKFRHQLVRNVRRYYTVNSQAAQKQVDVIPKHLQTRIKLGGPITIAEYMKQVLIHPLGGYYMHRDVFGAGGDFVTSPELGQVFGEMVAIWFLNEWSKVGSPKPVQIVELGPGRGTLCSDLLRVFKHFDALKEASVHLVEVSPALSDLQSRKLCSECVNIKDTNSEYYKEGISFQGVPIRWYRNYQDVPAGFSLVLAHEFFDVLPIHKFQKTDQGYREVLIDIDPENTNGFRYIVARADTPATKLFIKDTEKREHFETSPEGLVLIKEMATRVERDGGMVLIADYGHEGEGTDTFRAFRKQKLHDPLVEPGTADITADVDFAALKEAAGEDGKVLVFGPVTQRDFLMRMGIEHRVKRLDECIKDEKQKEALLGGFHMMTDEDKMGAKFKFMALLPAVLEGLLKKVPVVGFQ